MTATAFDQPVADSTHCDVLGVNISAVNLTTAPQLIFDFIARREHTYVCITGVHGVMESQRDPSLKKIHNEAGMVTPDGMPMVWINKLRGNSHVTRVYGPDLMLEVCQQGVARGTKHFMYGGADGVAELLKQKLEKKFPGIQIVGTYTPPFRPLTEDEDKAICEQITTSGADIVWVGLSTPKQERWMSKHVGKFAAPVMVGVGAAFDFHAGLKSQAPRWIGKLGMEWFYRLCTEPKRLWKRYLVNNPLFIYNFTLQTLGLKRFDVRD